MGVGPVGRSGTAGDDTAAVAVAQGALLGGGREPGGAPEVEDLGSGGDDASEAGVGEPAADQGAGDGSLAVDVAADLGEI